MKVIRKTSKKILAILLSIAVVSAIAGCGGNSGAPASGAASGDTASVENPSENDASSNEGAAAAGYSADDPLVLKFSAHYPETQDGGKYALELCDKIKEATEGRVIVEFYGSGVLGSTDEVLSMLDNGTCDIAAISPTAFPTQFPCSNIVSQPLIEGFESPEQMCNALWDVYEAYPEEFSAAYEGYHVWYMYCNSQGCLGMNKEVNSLEDLKGTNIRTFNDATTSLLTKAGLNPVVIPIPDLYSSVEKGTVDGYFFDVGGIDSWLLYDVTSYVYEGGLYTAPGHIFISDRAWNQLTEEDQKILDSFGGREGSVDYTTMMNLSQTKAEEALGDSLIQIAPGNQLYDELAVYADEATEEWISAQEADGLPMGEMFDFFKSSLEKY